MSMDAPSAAMQAFLRRVGYAPMWDSLPDIDWVPTEARSQR
jgi:hypothetical protein